MKRTEDKKQREMERGKKMEGVCSVCPASEPPAKQMMINEAVGRPAPRSVHRMESRTQAFST